jgi:hypothetical protein
MFSGLILRVLCQPLITLFGVNGPDVLLRLGLALSGLLELLGASLALALLAATFRGLPPLTTRPRLIEILPFLAVAFASLWIALAANLVAVVSTPSDGVLTGPPHELSLLIALYGFLVPVSVGIGARLFPLHYAAHQPDIRLLRAGLVLLVGSVCLRVAAEISDVPIVGAVGLVGMAAALGFFIIGARVFSARRVVPGGRTSWYTDAAQWHGLMAFCWLSVDAILLVWAGVSTVMEGIGTVPLHAEWHIVGIGFVTLLIFGEAVKLLPGFAGRPLRTESLVWATLIFGGLAVLLRVGPVLSPETFFGVPGQTALIASAFAGLVATVALAANLTGGSRRSGGPAGEED